LWLTQAAKCRNDEMQWHYDADIRADLMIFERYQDEIRSRELPS